MRIALVNCVALPEPDPDEAPLLAALRRAGHDARTLAWDDPHADPGAFDVCVLRATWNYHQRLDDFLAWCDRADGVTRLVNAPEVVRWNAHKRYLADLERAGVPIVPTAFVPQGSGTALRSITASRGWSDVVIKPAVSGGSFATRRFAPGQQAEGEAFLSEWAAKRDMMVQPYLPSVERGGERALVWVAGAFTHAIEKHPRFSNEAERVTARSTLTPDERAFGMGVLAAASRGFLYARVDVMELESGELVLSELELIEPSLFFEHSPTALDRFVEAVEMLG